MSTIQHHTIHVSLWWYAAAAVLAGAVLALILATLSATGPVDTHQDLTSHTHGGAKYARNPYVCHAGHPDPNAELSPCVRPGA